MSAVNMWDHNWWIHMTDCWFKVSCMMSLPWRPPSLNSASDENVWWAQKKKKMTWRANITGAALPSSQTLNTQRTTQNKCCLLRLKRISLHLEREKKVFPCKSESNKIFCVSSLPNTTTHNYTRTDKHTHAASRVSLLRKHYWWLSAAIAAQ